jgi:hypothetical protein
MWAGGGDNRLFGRPSTDEPPTGDNAPGQAPGESRLWSASDWSLPREPDEDGDTNEPPRPTGDPPTEP